jgi:hypothetical protein
MSGTSKRTSANFVVAGVPVVSEGRTVNSNQPTDRSGTDRVLHLMLPAGLIGLAVCLVLLVVAALTGFQDVEQWRVSAIMNVVLAVTLTVFGWRYRRSR